jgi:hypothetical protein
MYQNDLKNWFRRYTIVATIFIGIGTIITGVLVPIVFSYGDNYTIAPMYRLYVIAGGLMMSFPISIHMTFAAFKFLHQVYSTRGFTIQEFLKDWILKQDGFRYIILLALNLFSLYCYIISATAGQNDTTVLSISN